MVERIEGGGRFVAKCVSVPEVDDWKAVELFEREAETLKTLDHPAIPNYVDHFDQSRNGRLDLWLIQQFVEGTPLDDQLETGMPWEEPRLRSFVQALLTTLQYLHDREPPVVHRDIKPSNIIETDDGFALVDFGTAHVDAAETAGGSTFVGTQGYMAPEQLYARAIPATDLYALGATVIHLASGIPPHQLPVDGIKLQIPDDLDLSTPFTAWLDRMVDPEEDRRPRDAAHAKKLLEEFDENPPDSSLRIDASDDVPESSGQDRLEVTRHPDALEFQLPAPRVRPVAAPLLLAVVIGGLGFWFGGPTYAAAGFVLSLAPPFLLDLFDDRAQVRLLQLTASRFTYDHLRESGDGAYALRRVSGAMETLVEAMRADGATFHPELWWLCTVVLNDEEREEIADYADALESTAGDEVPRADRSPAQPAEAS